MWEWLLALLGGGGEAAGAGAAGAGAGLGAEAAAAGVEQPMAGAMGAGAGGSGFMSSLGDLARSNYAKAAYKGALQGAAQQAFAPSMPVQAPLMPPPRGGSGVYRPSAYTFAELMKALASKPRRSGTPFATGGGPYGA
jgi:hypothetical protein